MGVSVGSCVVIRWIASGNQEYPPIHSLKWNLFPNAPKRDPPTMETHHARYLAAMEVIVATTTIIGLSLLIAIVVSGNNSNRNWIIGIPTSSLKCPKTGAFRYRSS